MVCHDVQSWLSALVDGALEPREATEVQAHLEGCATCRTYLAQLQATVAVLREVAPMRAPEEFAATVRARLESLPRTAGRAGWQRLKVTWPRVQWRWRTAAAVAAVAVVAVFAVNLVREVVPRSEVGSESFRRGVEAPAQLGGGVGPSVAPGALPRAAQPVGPPGEPIPLRRVIRTGHVTMEVEDFDDAGRRLLAIAEGAGGFVADSSYGDEGGTRRGTFVLRVPAGRFADVLRQVEALGTVRRRQVTGQDVTEEFIDLELRVRNLERQEARLLALMERATRIPDLMAIESELGRVRGEIERLTGRLRFLSHRVDLATITAEVSQKARKAPGGFWDVGRVLARVEAAFLNTVRLLLGAVEGLAVFAAAVLPVVLPAALGLLVIRRLSRRADRPI